MNSEIYFLKIESELKIERIMKKFNNVYCNPLEESNLKELAKKFYINAEVYVAVINNVEVGYIAFYSNDMKNKIAYISQIAVSDEFQGYGIGKKLIEKCIEESSKKGMDSIKLEVYKQNLKAIKFYEKNEFKIMNTNEKKVIYTKDIGKK